MAIPNLTPLCLHADRTTLSDGAAPELVIGVGVDDIVGSVFRHDPTAIEIERAIDRVEDALGASGARQSERGELRVAYPPLLAALGLTADGMRLSRDEVEARFERLAAAALGQPGALAGVPVDRAGAAALLILRECMHHLGYSGVHRGS